MPNQLETLVGQLGAQLEELLSDNDAANDIKKSAKALAQSSLAKLDLVSREEFDAQAAVLAKTREKLDQLEKQLAQLSQ